MVISPRGFTYKIHTWFFMTVVFEVPAHSNETNQCPYGAAMIARNASFLGGNGKNLNLPCVLPLVFQTGVEACHNSSCRFSRVL